MNLPFLFRNIQALPADRVYFLKTVDRYGIFVSLMKTNVETIIPPSFTELDFTGLYLNEHHEVYHVRSSIILRFTSSWDNPWFYGKYTIVRLDHFSFFALAFSVFCLCFMFFYSPLEISEEFIICGIHDKYELPISNIPNQWLFFHFLMEREFL